MKISTIQLYGSMKMYTVYLFYAQIYSIQKRKYDHKWFKSRVIYIKD